MAASFSGCISGIVRALVAAGDDHVHDFGALGAPARDGAAADELGVVGVGHHDHRALGGAEGVGIGLGLLLATGEPASDGANGVGESHAGTSSFGAGGDNVPVEGLHAAGDLVPAEALDGVAGGAGEVRAQLGVANQHLELLRERLRAAPRDQVAVHAVGHGRDEPADARGDDGRAAGHRLDGDQPEALVVARHNADIGGAVPGG